MNNKQKQVLENFDGLEVGMEPIGWESLLGAIARGWCHEANANKTMDVDLANAIAKEVDALYATQLAAARLQGAEEMKQLATCVPEMSEEIVFLNQRITDLERVNQGLIIALKSCWDFGIDPALVPQVRAAISAAEKEAGK